MVVFGVGYQLVVRMRVTKIDQAHDAHIAEVVHGAIERRLVCNALVKHGGNIVQRERLVRTSKDVEDCKALRRRPQACRAELLCMRGGAFVHVRLMCIWLYLLHRVCYT